MEGEGETEASGEDLVACCLVKTGVGAYDRVDERPVSATVGFSCDVAWVALAHDAVEKDVSRVSSVLMEEHILSPVAWRD